MSIMDFFRGTPASQQAAQQPPQQAPNGQPTAPANPAANPTAVAGSEPEKVSAQDEVSPMDAYKDLWQTPVKKDGEPEEFNPSAIFNLNRESMNKALESVDFAKSVTQEQAAAIQAGGTEAFGALQQILNSVARETMGAATTASAKMIEQALTGATGALDKKIDSQVRQKQVSSHLQELNPALSHPAAAPMLEALKTQFTNKYPQASPAEIAKMTTDYATQFAGMMAGKPQKEDPAAVPKGETDWDKFMSL